MQRSRNLWWAVASLAAMIAGAFGPWATVLGFITINGTDDGRDGWVVFGAAVAAGAVLLLRRRAQWPAAVSLLAGAVGAATTGYDISDIGSLDSTILGDSVADLAWGIYVALAGSVSLIVASVALILERTRSRPADEAPAVEVTTSA